MRQRDALSQLAAQVAAPCHGHSHWVAAPHTPHPTRSRSEPCPSPALPASPRPAMELLLEQVKEVTKASDQFAQEKLLVNMRDDMVGWGFSHSCGRFVCNMALPTSRGTSGTRAMPIPGPRRAAGVGGGQCGRAQSGNGRGQGKGYAARWRGCNVHARYKEATEQPDTRKVTAPDVCGPGYGKESC